MDFAWITCCSQNVPFVGLRLNRGKPYDRKKWRNGRRVGEDRLALPSASASQLARGTQLILQHEMGLCDVIDPWAGSYMMESLTAELAGRARGDPHGLGSAADSRKRGGDAGAHRAHMSRDSRRS
ncbi:methylmalonyl-CoA mutase family protein [Caballeronia glebae]|uniref:methylmalonyl-CoA mutase family protein n=1 Tax=Caballeronia glebae TaxID=1777143 RepID=UPI0038B923D1